MENKPPLPTKVKKQKNELAKGLLKWLIRGERSMELSGYATAV